MECSGATDRRLDVVVHPAYGRHPTVGPDR